MMINSLVFLNGCDSITIVLLLDKGDIAFGSFAIGVSLSLLIMLYYYMIDSNPDPKDFDKKERKKRWWLN